MKKISKKELNKRVMLILLSLFSLFLTNPIYTYFIQNYPINKTLQILIGVGGILAILYLFKT